MRVPSTGATESEEDVVSFGIQNDAYRTVKESSSDTDQLPRLLLGTRRRRPLPSTKILAAMVESDSPTGLSEPNMCPLIRDYICSLEKEGLIATNLQDKKTEKDLVAHQQQEETVDDSNESSSLMAGDDDSSAAAVEASTSIPAIDDTRLSTLSQRQHDRYLELLSLQVTSQRPVRMWKERTRKEFYNLRQLVEKEQTAYYWSVQEFWQQQDGRILMCFTNKDHAASVFADMATMGRGGWIHWKEKLREAVLAGLPAAHQSFEKKCCQIISLPNASLQTTRNSENTLDLDSFDAEKVGREDVSASNPPVVESFPQPLDTISSPRDDSSESKDKNSSPFTYYLPLRDDQKALALAKECKVDILTSSEAMAALLQDPANACWILPVASDRNDTSLLSILELPIPQSYTSPRSCLTTGLNEGMYQWVERRQAAKEQVIETFPPEKPSYSYTLWKLPPSRNKRLSLLVRDRVRLLDGLSSSSARPLKIQTRVEYFPERGQELPSSYEKVLWLLNHLLHPEGCTVLVTRVDARTCQVLSVDQVSRAHALVEDDSTPPRVADLWQNMIRVLHAVPTIGSGHHVLCLPARNTSATSHHRQMHSVSVHRANEQGEIRLEDEVALAGDVSMDPVALKSSFRPWKWQAQRVPYTYPPMN